MITPLKNWITLFVPKKVQHSSFNVNKIQRITQPSNLLGAVFLQVLPVEDI